MEDITHDDLKIIYQGAYMMAHVVEGMRKYESIFLGEIVAMSGLSDEEVEQIQHADREAVESLSQQLSSPKAKKLFLLTIVGMALADEVIDEAESQLIDALTLKLNVGKVKAQDLNFRSCETMVLKLLSGLNRTVLKDRPIGGPQPSDLDFFCR